MEHPVLGNPRMKSRVLVACGAFGLLAVGLLSGCAAFRPLEGVPARYLGDEYKLGDRNDKQTIDLGLLRRDKPPAHIVDSGDVLAVYIEGELGDRGQVPPVFLPTNGDRDMNPAFGFPIPVRDDGTISLPLIGSISVRGMTVMQIEQLLRHKYLVERQLLNPEAERILVSLQRPRQYRVLVIRQEAGNDLQAAGGPGQINLGLLKRGNGRVVSLPIYENDVLHALAETGGLPGLDAENAIYIIRREPVAPLPAGAGGHSPPRAVVRGQSPDMHGFPPPGAGYPSQGVMGPAMPQAPGWPAESPMLPPGGMMPVEDWSRQYGALPSLHGNEFDARRVVRIPIRLGPGEEIDVRQADVILHDGDIVFIESRDTEVFYTGGLLGGGQYTLPRDYDLNILEAIAIAQGTRAGGGGGSRSQSSPGGVSALNADVSISGSSVVVLRPMPDGSQLTIHIDIYRALRDPAERVVIQPGDYILLQYTKIEAIGAFVERHLFEGALFGLAAAQFNRGN